MERWPSGRRHHIANVARGKTLRRFESSPLRHITATCVVAFMLRMAHVIFFFGMEHKLLIRAFVFGFVLGILPMLFLEKILRSIGISLLFAFPLGAYAIGALPIALSARDIEKDCPYCQKNHTKQSLIFTANHIRTSGSAGIHAWGMRAKMLAALFWMEIGLFTGTAFLFVL